MLNAKLHIEPRSRAAREKRKGEDSSARAPRPLPRAHMHTNGPTYGGTSDSHTGPARWDGDTTVLPWTRLWLVRRLVFANAGPTARTEEADHVRIATSHEYVGRNREHAPGWYEHGSAPLYFLRSLVKREIHLSGRDKTLFPRSFSGHARTSSTRPRFRQDSPDGTLSFCLLLFGGLAG